MRKILEKQEMKIYYIFGDFGKKNGSDSHFEVKARIPRRLERLSGGKKNFLKNFRNSEILF